MGRTVILGFGICKLRPFAGTQGSQYFLCIKILSAKSNQMMHESKSLIKSNLIVHPLIGYNVVSIISNLITFPSQAFSRFLHIPPTAQNRGSSRSIPTNIQYFRSTQVGLIRSFVRRRFSSDVLHRTLRTTIIMTDKWDCKGRSLDLTGKKKLVIVDFDNTRMLLHVFAFGNS
jgi:hypothetical protein